MLFLCGVVFLMQGIHISSFKTPYFSLENLYFKLEKKFILRLDSLHINAMSQTAGSTDELDKFFQNANYIKIFFKELIFDKISYENNMFALTYFGDEFTLDSNYITLVATFDESKASIDELNLKDFDLSFKGDMNVDFSNQSFDLNGSVSSFDVNGDIKAWLNKGILDFEASNVKASNIDDFMNSLAKNIDLDEEIKKWIYVYIKAKNYEIYSFKGSIDIKGKRLTKLDGLAHASDASLFLSPSLKPILFESIDIELANDNLNFTLNAPSFEGKSLEGSKVIITNITGKNSHVIVDLSSEQISLDDAKPILANYDINVGLLGSSAPTTTALRLDIALEPFDVRADGNFAFSGKQPLRIGETNFYSSVLDLDLNGTILNFKKANLSADFLDIDFSGELNLSSDKGSLNTHIKRLNIADNLLDIKNLKTTANLDLAKDFEISIADFDFVGNFSGKKRLDINNLSKVIKYSPLLNDLNATAGSFKLGGDDFTNFGGAFELFFNYGLKDQNQNSYNHDIFTFTVAKEGFNLTSRSGKILAKNNKQGKLEVFVNNIIIPIDQKGANEESKTSITYIGKNSSLYLTDFNRTLNFSSFTAKFGNGLDFEGDYGNGKINVLLKENQLSISGKNLPDTSINDFLGGNLISEGSFDIKLEGKDFKNFKAIIEAKNTYFLGLKAQQNLLAFLDSIPSLIIFKVKDFTKKGFEAKEAKVQLKRNGDLLAIEALAINGSNADIYGSGGINTNTKDIKMQLQLSMLKSVSSTLKYIPIVSQIVLDDNKSISTVIDISGSYDDPKYTSSVTTDILSTPFNLIKNTLTLPFNLFK